MPLGCWRSALAACIAVAFSTVPATAQITTFDGDGGASSLAIGSDGLGLIAYLDGTNGHLKVAHCSNVACTSATLATLDASGSFEWPRIAIGGDGLGLIAYRVAGGPDPLPQYVAHCRDISCSSADISMVGYALAVEDIAVPSDGRGLISFTSSGGVGGLGSSIRHCTDAVCSSAPLSATVPGGSTSIAIGSDGFGLVTYIPGFISIGVLHCTNAPCSTFTSGTLEQLVNGRGIVVVGDGRGLFHYNSFGGPPSAMAHCVDTACSAITTAPAPDDLRNPAVGTDGLALFTHGVGSGSNLSFRIAHCSDVACTSYTFSQSIDSGGGASLRVGSDGMPLMAYGGGKVAHCVTADCVETSIAVGDASALEDAGGPGLAFSVGMSAPSPVPVSVTYSTGLVGDTATPGVDYVPVSGTLTFAPGTTSQQIVVPLLGDLLDEDDEVFILHLDATTSGVFSDATGTGTILDDDDPPTISVSDATVGEGGAAGSIAPFVLTLSVPSGKSIQVNASTSDGTAVVLLDYLGVSGGYVFSPGTTSRTIEIPILPDTLDEADETFTLDLGAAQNVVIADGHAVGTIIDDDAPPSLSITDAAVVEGDVGTGDATLLVTLSAPSGLPVGVDWQTAAGPGATATPGVDFVVAGGTLSFAPGQSAQSVAASVIGDTSIETDEVFHVQLTAPTNATFIDDLGEVVISDDDAPSLSFDELVHGSERRGDLEAQPGPVAARDHFRLGQRPYSSWEVVVDGASGGTPPLVLERLAADNVTVLQTGTTVTGGSSVSMRWRNETGFPVTNQHLSVRSAGCGASCDASAGYRIRAYETTGRIERFNNSATQVTVVVLGNAATAAVQGTVWFWSATGALLASQPFALGPQASQAFSTAAIPALAGTSGSIMVSHDAPHGVLAGKAVAVEPATGFSFDTPLTYRPR